MIGYFISLALSYIDTQQIIIFRWLYLIDRQQFKTLQTILIAFNMRVRVLFWLSCFLFHDMVDFIAYGQMFSLRYEISQEKNYHFIWWLAELWFLIFLRSIFFQSSINFDFSFAITDYEFEIVRLLIF